MRRRRWVLPVAGGRMGVSSHYQTHCQKMMTHRSCPQKMTHHSPMRKRRGRMHKKMAMTYADHPHHADGSAHHCYVDGVARCVFVVRMFVRMFVSAMHWCLRWWWCRGRRTTVACFAVSTGVRRWWWVKRMTMTMMMRPVVYACKRV